MASKLAIIPAYESHTEQGKDYAGSERQSQEQVIHTGPSCSGMLAAHSKPTSPIFPLEQQLKRIAYDFQDTDPSSEAFGTRLATLSFWIKEHIKREEDHVVGPLETALAANPVQSHNLAKRFERTKHFVPSRSHLNKGYHWIYGAIETLFEVPGDRFFDLMRKWPQKETAKEIEEKPKGASA